MTEYSRWKVPELKAELKNRKIPLTGLKLKQNYIDKLLEADAQQQQQQQAQVVPSHAATASTATGAQHAPTAPEPGDQGAASQEIVSDTPQPTQASPARAESRPESHLAVQQDRPGEKQTSPTVNETQPASTPLPAANESNETPARPDEAAVDTLQFPSASATDQAVSHPLADGHHVPSSIPVEPAPRSPALSGEVTAPDSPHDSKKRKRRSASPPLADVEAAQKRVRTSNGSAVVTRTEEPALDGMPQEAGQMDTIMKGDGPSQKTADGSSPQKDEGEPTPSAQAEPGHSPERPRRSSRSPSPVEHSPAYRENQSSSHPPQEKARPVLKSPVLKSPVSLKTHSPDLFRRPSAPSSSKGAMGDDRHISPAVHPATSALYIRNFKRPLHVVSLRNHISALAAPPGADKDEEPIASFYLDSIRTHAFISFTSVNAASRVRSALHDSRFPDEKTREPLWVDFVPEDKVQKWSGIEQDSAGDGRLGRRWEVVYHDAADGIDAVLQEIGSGGHAAGVNPSVRSAERNLVEPPTTSTTAPSVHPDRSRSVRPDEPMRARSPRATSFSSQPDPRPSTGFKALDDLFPSTKTAKPKLYYKPVTSPSIIEDRLDLIRDLRHVAGARTGEPDMNRYSFDVFRGRDEWVDKGPEFGFGKGGGGRHERGGGYGGRYGGPRGGRGGRGGGDSWRSGDGRHR